MISDVSKKILNTICYYDALSYPLTLFEIWKYLTKSESDEDKKNKLKKDDDENLQEKYSLNNILKELRTNNNLKSFIKNNQGFYFLKGREYLVEERIKRDKLSVMKIKRLQWLIYFLRCVPFVRMILVTGRLAMKNAQPKSDWDVLVVLKSGKIWTGRTAITIVTQLLGKRRYGSKIRNRVCLNYFITTNSLEIRNKDFFSANEYFFAMPIFVVGNYFKKFQLKNSWIKNYKPNYYLSEARYLKAVDDNYFSKKVRTILEKIVDFDWLEKYLEKIEKKKIKNNPNTQKINSLIEADDQALIFLPEPQGPKIFEKFKDNIDRLWR
ncbi:MAG TPA: hypothetical protein ENJ27_02060 [Candidatus Moranbacteria bacterium]|nr:hypothetical protein [Candidatus Moranbacteria bacterium]